MTKLVQKGVQSKDGVMSRTPITEENFTVKRRRMMAKGSNGAFPNPSQSTVAELPLPDDASVNRASFPVSQFPTMKCETVRKALAKLPIQITA